MSSEEITFIQAKSAGLRRSETGDTYAVIDGKEHFIGHILSVFPISNKGRFISLRDAHGVEIGIVEQAQELDQESKRIMKEELERSYFLPKIKDIYNVDDHLNLFTFHVETDRGPRVFEVRNPRQNVRPVGGDRYIIKDVDGNRYDIPKLRNLGPKSQYFMTEFV